MVTVLLDKVKAGMRLSKPVLDQKGKVLLAADTLLLAEDLEQLSALGIKYISVEEHSALPKGKTEVDPERFDEELEQRFSRVPPHPLLSKIKESLRAEFNRLKGKKEGNSKARKEMEIGHASRGTSQKDREAL